MLHKQNEKEPALSENQVTFVQHIKSKAQNLEQVIHDAINVFQVFQLLAEPVVKNKLILATTKEFIRISATIDITSISPILMDEHALLVIMRLLGLTQKNDAELSVHEDGDWVWFVFSNLINPPHWLKGYLDPESNQLSCKEQIYLYDGICPAVALVEKYGGKVYATLGDDDAYRLSFTLPVYREVV